MSGKSKSKKKPSDTTDSETTLAQLQTTAPTEARTIPKPETTEVKVLEGKAPEGKASKGKIPEGKVLEEISSQKSERETATKVPVEATVDMAVPQTAMIMDQELSRVRTELSRATFTCERREMEAARADADLRHYHGDLARISALKIECDRENWKLQTDVASLERERARLASETERLKEELQRAKTKLADRKKQTSDLKAQLKMAQDARDQMERSVQEREMTWQTIRRDVTAKRDDAIRDSCKVRRENEKLKLNIKKLKTEKSNILIRVWEKKQLHPKEAEPSKPSFRVYNDIKADDEASKSQRPIDESQQAKILSLELQLFRQARLVELLLDVIQAQDPQFSAEERKSLTSAFADADSIPEMLSKKLKLK